MMDDTLILQLSGKNRVVSIEVTLKHVAQALRGLDLPNGDHTIEIHRDGCISVNGLVAYKPARMQLAKRGAA